MDEINLNLLKLFMEVATSNSFLEAADKLYISQPAISKSISKLEQSLHVKLFYRENKGITLTQSGEILLKYLRESKNILRSCERELLSVNNIENGKIIIGVQSHIARNYLLDKIKHFKEKHPTFKIEILDMPTTIMLKYLVEKKIDFIIDSSPVDSIYKNIDITPIAILNTCFISNQNEIIQINKIEDLDKFSLIMPPLESNIRKNLNSYFRNYKYEFKPLFEFDTEELIIESVKKGFGIGYIIEPSDKAQLNNNKLNKVTFNYSLPKIEITLVTVDSYLNNASKLFINEEIEKEE